jgi:hypothetical protein
VTTIRIARDLANENNLNRGWETYAASGFVNDVETGRYISVVFFTANNFAAFSVDGAPFAHIDPEVFCNQFGESFCCDQVVVFDPQFGIFIWVLQTQTGNYLLAVTKPQEFLGSGDLNWTVYLLKSTVFDKSAPMDRPSISVAPYYLYMTFNLAGEHSVALRILLSELAAGAPLQFNFFHATEVVSLRPVKNCGTTGFFVAEHNTSELHVYAWPIAGAITDFIVQIPTIPTEGYATWIPSGHVIPKQIVWLNGTSKIDNSVQGATMSGNAMWVVWTGGRRISGQQSDTFLYPHIGVAIIDVVTHSLLLQRHIWNPNYGFAWPDVATNINGDIGMSVCYGGPNDSPQWAVGMFTGESLDFARVSTGMGGGAGGHYTSCQRSYATWSYFDGIAFSASGFKQVNEGNGKVNHPYYAVFTY